MGTEHLQRSKDVHHARNTGMPTGRETQGIGDLVVLSGWESQLQGEAGQVEAGKRLRGSRDDRCSERKYRRHWRAVCGKSRMHGSGRDVWKSTA